MAKNGSPLVVQAAGLLLFFFSGNGALAQAPLGEQIDQEQTQMSQDRAHLNEDERAEQKKEESTEQYIQSTQNWINQADSQAQVNQNKLNALESGKSKSTLFRLLNTPGNELYVLNSWLKNEAQERAQAQNNLQSAENSLSENRSVIEQDRHQIMSDSATLERDKGTFRTEMDNHADLLRQAQNARYAGDRLGTRRGRFYTDADQSSYDAGYHDPGTGYWGNRNKVNGYSGQ